MAIGSWTVHLTQHTHSTFWWACSHHSVDLIVLSHLLESHYPGAGTPPSWRGWSSALAHATFYVNYSQLCLLHPVLLLYIAQCQKPASIPGVNQFPKPAVVVHTINRFNWFRCGSGHVCVMEKHTILRQHDINNATFQYLNCSRVSHICKVPRLIVGCTIATKLNLSINLISLTV